MFLKRVFLLFFVFILFLFSSCAKSGEAERFTRRGRYSVTETETGVGFTAALDGGLTDLVFTSPETLNGLRAKSSGGGYVLSYAGLEAVCVGGVSVGSDFSAALAMLEEAGVFTGGVLTASVDGAAVKGVFDKDGLREVEFSNGGRKRIYKVRMEAK